MKHLPQWGERTCPCCQTHFDRLPVECDEDGAYAVLEARQCQHPGCEVLLCPCCPQFTCDGCGQAFCLEHRVLDYGREPECTCIRLDVDLYDSSGCEKCNPRSEYHTKPLELCAACAAPVEIEVVELPAPLPLVQALEQSLLTHQEVA